MTLKEYLENIQKLVDENPNLLYLQVISSSDDEGNSFSPVIYTATPGYYDGEYKGNFISDEEELEGEDLPINAICIN
jgi:hypothetical protein